MNGYCHSLLLASVLAFGIAAAQPDIQDPSSSQGTMSSQDEKIMKDLAQANVNEIELGKLAQKNGTNTFGMSFGERMVNDHQKAQDELEGIAARKGVRLPTTMDMKHNAIKAMLQGRLDRSFDKEYCMAMCKGHAMVERMYRDAQKNATDSDLKAYIDKYLPTVVVHTARSQTNVGAPITAGVGKPSPSQAKRRRTHPGDGALILRLEDFS